MNSFDLRLKAPAKINLVLRVLARRSDGYHELETWMQKVGLFDVVTLRLRKSPGIEMSCSTEALPQDEGNLVWRAAELFFRHSVRSLGWGLAIDLQKNIPIAAGLGGGSSDAGTVLRGLNTFFDNELSEEALLELALMLGADVPFFTVHAQSVLATGVGEKMVPVSPLSPCSFLLVNPGFSVSTAAVFEKFALTEAAKNSTISGLPKLRPETLTLSDLENDLEKVTLEMFPVIGDIKDELRDAGADHVLMSGSGPTVFAVFTGSLRRRHEAVERAADRMRRTRGEILYRVE